MGIHEESGWQVLFGLEKNRYGVKLNTEICIIKNTNDAAIARILHCFIKNVYW